LNTILDATKSVCANKVGLIRFAKKRNINPKFKEFTNVPDETVSVDELVTFLGIQMVIIYHRLSELLMYWEQRPNSANAQTNHSAGDVA
jgi:hypothetical protein